MVKNTKGGKGSKGLARKLTNSYETHRLRTSSSPEEKYAIVSKMLGNGMCHITTADNTSLICHIRNKFRGRSKRGNFVTKDTIVLNYKWIHLTVALCPHFLMKYLVYLNFK